MGDGVIGDFVTFVVELLGEPVVVPLVGNVKGSSDGAAVGVHTVGGEDLLVKPGMKIL